MMYTVLAGEKWVLFCWLYRFISFYVLMVLITIFAAVRFSSPYVPNYADRNNDTFQRDFGLFCYVWTWTAGIISQCMAVFVFYVILNGPGEGNVTNRDIVGYLRDGNIAEAVQLIEFGVDVNYVDERGNVE